MVDSGESVVNWSIAINTINDFRLSIEPYHEDLKKKIKNDRISYMAST